MTVIPSGSSTETRTPPHLPAWLPADLARSGGGFADYHRGGSADEIWRGQEQRMLRCGLSGRMAAGLNGESCVIKSDLGKEYLEALRGGRSDDADCEECAGVMKGIQ
jgi:hypothetical protein